MTVWLFVKSLSTLGERHNDDSVCSDHQINNIIIRRYVCPSTDRMFRASPTRNILRTVLYMYVKTVHTVHTLCMSQHQAEEFHGRSVEVGVRSILLGSIKHQSFLDNCVYNLFIYN